MYTRLDDILDRVNIAMSVIPTTSGASFSAKNDGEMLTLSSTKKIFIKGHIADSIYLMFIPNDDTIEFHFSTSFGLTEVTAENAEIAFEASEATALNVTLTPFLTIQLGGYLFNDSHVCNILVKYFNDLAYLIQEDKSTKLLLKKAT